MRTAEPAPADRVSFRPASAAAAVDSLQGLQRQTILEDSRPHAPCKSLRTPPAMSSTTDSEQENLETTAAAPAEPFDWQPWLWGGLLALLVVLVYWPTLGNAYIWDDDSYVLSNLALRSPEGLYNMWFKWGAIPQYYPLVHTTLWFEYQLWGFDPHGYHLVNMLLHATGVILLWRVLLRLNVPGAWLAAAIFAVHPVCVESVAWVSELKNVQSCALALASILVYLRDMRRRTSRPMRSGHKRDGITSWRWDCSSRRCSARRSRP